MARLPPPLPSAEQIGEAWTDEDPRPAKDPLEGTRSFDGPVFVDLREREMRDVDWHDKPFLPAGELITNNADGDTGKGLLLGPLRGQVQPRRVRRPAHGRVRRRRGRLRHRAEAAAGRRRGEPRPTSAASAGGARAPTTRLRIPDDVPVLEQHLATMERRAVRDRPAAVAPVGEDEQPHRPRGEAGAAAADAAGAQPRLRRCSATATSARTRRPGARRASMGSTAFTNTPRVGLAMAYDDEDPDVRVVEVIKSNIGPKGVGRNYRLKTVDVDGLTEPMPLLVAESAGDQERRRADRRQPAGAKRIPGELVRELVLAELESGEKSRSVPGHGRRGEAGREPRHRLPVGARPRCGKTAGSRSARRASRAAGSGG